MPIFSRFKNKGAQPASRSRIDASNADLTTLQKPQWQSTWNSKTIVPEEVEDLIHACTAEMKTRAEALDAPFLLLPFRPGSDASGSRTFIRNYYKSNLEGLRQYTGTGLRQELRLTEPIVLCGILRWCWSRMPGGVVTWPVYDGFQIGERESNWDRNAFNTFIPISADSPARKSIIFDFFDLLAAVAAHGKMNGLGGRKLSRMAGWWAFEHSDDGKGFEGGYKSWTTAADASSHLFFAYLRSLSPEANPAMSLIERIPRSLQALLASTEYPPETPALLQNTTPRVVMLVDAVSPTPFALLRRAKHFEYRDRDRVLCEYSEFEDPMDALTDECRRVLYAIASTNSSAALSRHSPLIDLDESWSAFSSLGFADMDEKSLNSPNGVKGGPRPSANGLQSGPRSRNADYNRPTTPSWADFLSSGFAEDEVQAPKTLLIPPDQVLPPLGSKVQIPARLGDDNDHLAPGELAAITNVDLDDAFWWVWMTSLAGEESDDRKAVFGRCALIETTIMNGRWLIMEEQVKGASPDPAEAAFVEPKKSFFSTFTKRGKLSRKRSTAKRATPSYHESMDRVASATPSKASLPPDQQSKIKQAAAALKKQDSKDDEQTQRRGRLDDGMQSKTNSMLTLGLQSEAGPAMKWTNAYDKSAIRAQYLGDSFAGKGMSRENLLPYNYKRASSVNMVNDGASSVNVTASPLQPDTTAVPREDTNRALPDLPKEEEQTSAGAEAPLREPEVPDTASPSPPGVIASPEPAKEPEPTPAVAAAVEAPAGPSAIEKEVGIEQASPNSAVGRKPVPRAADHPARRQPSVAPSAPAPPTQSPLSAKGAAAIAANRAMQNTQNSPEAMKNGSARQIKKQTAAPTSGGLKKLFGRKKDATNRQSMDVNNSGLAPPAQPPARHSSLLRRRGGPKSTPVTAAPPPPHAAAASELDSPHLAPNSHGQFEQSTSNVSQLDPHDKAHAEREFARFDQGPLEDMPAAAPGSPGPNPDETPEIVAPRPQRKFENSNFSLMNEQEHFATPMEEPEEQRLSHHEEAVVSDDKDASVLENDDAQSEATMERGTDVQQQPVQDRWATIRENAARRAARVSEEQSESRPSQGARTDEDGETSGEETIESRVARIKARVAELTGGMDAAGVRR